MRQGSQTLRVPYNFTMNFNRAFARDRDTDRPLVFIPAALLAGARYAL